MTTAPLRLRLARAVLSSYPLRRGRTIVERAMLAGFDGWPERDSFDFRYGRFIDTSLAPWPDGYRELWLHGFMEPSYTEMLVRLLRPGDVFFDGGANAGYFSLVAAHQVAEAGRVLAFEPIPETARVLRANVAASRTTVIEVVQAALASEQGFLELRVFDDDPSGCQSSVADRPGLTVQRVIRCPATTIDGFVAEQGIAPTMIKLDIEGAEFAALQGARRTIEVQRCSVWVEYNDATASGAGGSADEVLRYLTERGYRAFLPQLRRGHLALAPFEKRLDLAQWSPMVLCIAPGHVLWERAARAGLVR